MPPVITLSLRIRFPVDQVAEYVFRSDVLRRWINRSCKLAPVLGEHASLPYVAIGDNYVDHEVADGEVTGLRWPTNSSLARVKSKRSHPADSQEWATNAPESSPTQHSSTDLNVPFCIEVTLPSFAHGQRLEFRLTPCPEGTCRLSLRISGIESPTVRHETVRLWQRVINRLNELLKTAEKRQRRERQAVLIVHGIGEQRPGQHLRQFVSSVFGKTEGEVSFLKPDYLSSLFEMRMATVPRVDRCRPTTDVYELYWAHLVRDTTVSQVYGWILRLIFAPKSHIPVTLFPLVCWSRWLLLPGAVILLAYLAVRGESVSAPAIGVGILAAAPALAKLILEFVNREAAVAFAGDAARYLEARPDNVGKRQQIREAGVALLDALHDRGRYERIIVYGHSLGSVIAHDILSFSWAKRSRLRQQKGECSSCALVALEDLLNPRDPLASAPSVCTVQAMQNEAWLEHRRNGFSWRVSDFVTAGSPLAHAQWLLNLDKRTKFSDLRKDRSLPTCPPQTQSVRTPSPGRMRNAFLFTHAYETRAKGKLGAKRSTQIPHHAGLFALTRWSNLYFPFIFPFGGDPVGGPLQENFGNWIRDIRLDQQRAFAHTWYSDRSRCKGAAKSLRDAMNLPFARRLLDYASEPEVSEDPT